MRMRACTTLPHGFRLQAKGHRPQATAGLACGLWLLFLLHVPLSSHAQQIAQYTQYVFNHFSINPAVAGSKDCLDIRLGYRKQWAGFAGAPQTAWASVHMAIRSKQPFVANRHGIGLWVEADDAGPYGYTLVYLAYAYHIQMSRDYFLSMGLFAGAKQMKLDAAEITTFDPFDPAITTSRSQFVYPEITPGIWAYNKRGWMGLSVHQVMGNKIPKWGLGESRLTRHYLLSAGYRYRFAKNISIAPSTLMKISPKSPLALDLNLMLEYHRKVGIGVGYRNVDAIAFMLKVSFMKYFQLGYSYDITTSKIRTASNNTHEILLAITPCPPNDPNRAIVKCPVWE